jgi:hypothetical protein
VKPGDSQKRSRAIRRFHSLFQVPGLEGLIDVCRRNRVTITCHGGAARRIAAAVMSDATREKDTNEETAEEDEGSAGDEPRWSIFDCVPFNSDLDLLHSGSPDKTAAILNDIYDIIPFAEHLRLELRSVEEQAEFDAAKTYAPIVPLCHISLSTHSGWKDPWKGLDDLADGQARFMRNGFYRDSPRFKNGLDIELLQVLLYYKAIIELPDLEIPQDSLNAARSVIFSTQRDFASLTRLEDSSYLRSRLRYFLSAIKGMAGATLAPGAPLFKTLALDAIDPILGGLGREHELKSILSWKPEEGHLSVTSRLGGDTYRLSPVYYMRWGEGETAGTELNEALYRLSPDADGGAFLADDQHIVLASPDLKCAPGIAPSSQDNEFLHFAIQAPNHARAESGDLGVVCLVSDANRTIAVGVPTVCVRPPRDTDTLTIRCNVGRVLNTHPDDTGRGVQLFVSELHSREARLV